MATMDIDTDGTLSLTDLPLDLLYMIARHVKRDDKVWLASTCRLFRHVFYDSKHLLEPDGTLYNRPWSFIHSASRMAFILTQTTKQINDHVLLRAIDNAAERGDIKTMALVLDKCRDTSYIKSNYKPYALAAENGDVDMIMWLRARGFHGFHTVQSIATKHSHLHVLDYLLSIERVSCGVLVYAAKLGHIDVLQWCKRNGVGDKSWGLNEAAVCGRTDAFRWLLENGWTPDDDTLNKAAEGGNVEILALTFTLRPIMTKTLCTIAATEGHTSVMQWAVSHSCPWDEQKCQRLAIAFGRLDTLQFILSVATILLSDICDYATSHSQWHILEWLLDNGYCDDARYQMYREGLERAVSYFSPEEPF